MGITYKENLKNMQRCPRFDKCSIPKCPLDYWMSERVELAEDERCILRGKTRSKRVRGSLTQRMRGISKFIYKKNRKV